MMITVMVALNVNINTRPLHVKVIPQYCTAHPVLHIITRNKIMAAFLAGKLIREKNGRFERHGLEKRWKFVAKKEKTVERKF